MPKFICTGQDEREKGRRNLHLPFYFDQVIGSCYVQNCMFEEMFGLLCFQGDALVLVGVSLDANFVTKRYNE